MALRSSGTDAQFLRNMQDGLNQYMKGDNSPSISKNDIENWLYPIPPIEEQRRICYILKSTFTTISKLEESLI